MSQCVIHGSVYMNNEPAMQYMSTALRYGDTLLKSKGEKLKSTLFQQYFM